ncbi:MAG: type VI secretion system baseplate subunit TssE [Planctomycetes bacterium]|nr:type VI secretion system baseplate subunit TssE [Planctomycetota bacterium]
MPDQTPRDLLQPSLLDRLTDDEPQKQMESRDKRVLSMRQLKEAVLRDLAWLLNTANFDNEGKFEKYPFVADSVINFGTRGLSGITASSVTSKEVESTVRNAILRFEPRIIPNTLQVQAVVSVEESSHNAISFVISGDLWASPLPEQLYLQTKLDIETGHTEISEVGSRGPR